MCSNSEFSIAASLEFYLHPFLEEVEAWVASEDGHATMVAGRIIRAFQNRSDRLARQVTAPAELPPQRRVTYPLPVSSTVPASSPSAPLLTDRQLHEELEAWAATEGGRARVAAERIKSAFQNRSTSLDLSSFGLKTLPTVICKFIQLQTLNLSENQLTTLPAVIGQLRQLKRLGLASNQLTTLPAEIGLLVQLKRLDLDSNQLTTLPAEIGQLLQLQELDLSWNRLTTLPATIGQLLQLQELDLSWNQLTTLPTVIGQLLQLKVLCLNSNQLTSLPAEIGQLWQLERLQLSSNQLTIIPAEIGQLRQLELLVFSENPALSEIPISFCNLLHITYLDTNETSIPHTQPGLVLTAIQRQRGAVAVERLPPKLNLWKSYAQMTDLNLDISVLDQGQKESLHEWLVRLERAKDFQRSQRSLCETACRILNTVLEDGTFRETFFVQVRDNLEGCGDRAAMSFNEIYTAWVLVTLPPDGTTHRKLEILIGVAKTNTLRSCLQQIIGTHESETSTQEQESVEIYLYYESLLREELSLVSAIQHMLYATIGRRDWIDISHLTRQVMESYLDTLIQIPAFDALIKQDSAFMEQWVSVEDRFQVQLASLPEDVTSEELLTRSVQIQEARNLEWKTAAIQWAQDS